MLIATLCLATTTLTANSAVAQSPPDYGPQWQRYAIDDRFDGPDGTKLSDINGDGLPDVVTGWESEGLTVVYLHPGHRFVRRSWPSVVVGATPKAEDAVFVDLNQDGVLDVVSSCEQRVEKVFVHWAPAKKEQLLVPQAWRQESFPAVEGNSQWMFAEPIKLVSQSGAQQLGLAIGGKNYKNDQSADLGLLLPGADPSKVADYRWRPLAKVSWTMSIVIKDLNGDGHNDILYSDKHGPGCGVWWLQNPGPKHSDETWQRHEISSGLDSAMLLSVIDIDGDGLEDVVVPVDLLPVGTEPKKRSLRILRRLDRAGLNWSTTDVSIPEFSGHPKALTAGDVNGDGRIDLVATSTGATDGQMGTYWLEYRDTPFENSWQVHRIAGPQGIKYDLVHLLDLDGDGDLDVLTNEEKQDEHGLGVFWYENPTKSTTSPHAKSELSQ